MDVKDSVIDLYNEVLTTNKELLKLTQTTKKCAKVIHNNINTIALATAVCMIIIHKTIKNQQSMINDLSEQVAELKKMKGE